MARIAVQGILADSNGTVIPNATCVVYLLGGVTLANIYATRTSPSPIAGSSLTTSAYGHWKFFWDDNDYAFPAQFDLKFNAPGFSTTWYNDVR